MDMNELKKLATELGGILVMNGNVPEFVVLPFANYKKLESDKKQAKPMNSDDENGAIERLNREILVLKEEIRQKEEAELLESDEEETTAEITNEGEIGQNQ